MRNGAWILLALVSPSAIAALSGSLETRFQYDDYFDPSTYMEQWLTMDYRRRGGGSAGLLANVGGGGGRTWVDIHRLYLQHQLDGADVDISAGRMERIDGRDDE